MADAIGFSSLSPRRRTSLLFLAASVVSMSGFGCSTSYDHSTRERADGAAGTDTSGTGTSGNGGALAAGGSGGTSDPPPDSSAPGFGTPVQTGDGNSSDRYAKSDVARDSVNYFFMANGWGPGFQSQSVTWSGTGFTVVSMQGMRGLKYEPASYPTVFCGVYSDSRSRECGLPKAISDISALRTGWRWAPNGNATQYNAAYDVWLGTGPTIQDHSAFLMVWLRDPPGQQPAGAPAVRGVTVSHVPGKWDIWSGIISGKPCISYARTEGLDALELEFDVMDFVRDLPGRSINAPGTHVLSVAVGFEIWTGPISNLESKDFYLKVE
jgi:hypothetical protein